MDRMLFWSASDLEQKLAEFQDFYNAHRAHAALEGRTPVPTRRNVARLGRYRWQAGIVKVNRLEPGRKAS